MPDSPDAYFATLPVHRVTRAEIDWISRRAPVPESVVERIGEHLMAEEFDHAACIFADIVAELPNELRAPFLEGDRFGIRTVETGQINAHAIACANGGWAVVVDSWLVALVYEFARIVSTQFATGGTPAVAAALPVDKAATLAGQVSDGYFIARRPFVPTYELEWWRTLAASSLATGAIQFTVAHEVAHYMLRHTERAQRVPIVVQGRAVDRAEWLWDDEFSADALGYNLTMVGVGTSPSAEKADPYIERFAGITLGLESLAFLADYGLARHGVSQWSDTHPPFAGRLARLRSQAATHCPDPDMLDTVFQLPEVIAEVFESFRHELSLPPTREHRHQGGRPTVGSANSDLSSASSA